MLFIYSVLQQIYTEALYLSKLATDYADIYNYELSKEKKVDQISSEELEAQLKEEKPASKKKKSKKSSKKDHTNPEQVDKISQVEKKIQDIINSVTF